VEFGDKECHTSLKEACVMSIRRMLFTWAFRTGSLPHRQLRNMTELLRMVENLITAA
jgi:hypothetical protein